MNRRLFCFLALAPLVSTPLLASDALPAWAGKAPNGDTVRVAVTPPENPRFAHLAWPKAVRVADGTIVLGYQAGTHHGDASCPAVSISTDGGKTFSAPQVLKEFGPGMEYTNSGNMALGVAHDGSVILLSHGHKSNTTNHIFGWRSTDSGRTWKPVDTSALGPNKTGSSTGSIVQLPGKRLMSVGHYRGGSKPYDTGIWRSISEDDGLTWGEPAMVNNLNAGEPVIVRHRDRLLVFIRGRGPANARQFISVSDDWGQTWKTELSNITAVGKHANNLAHPFAMVNPHAPDELLAITFERPAPGSAQLWKGDPKTLSFKRTRALIELPKIENDKNTDFGYAWLVPMEGRRALVFYYHGLGRGACPIWVIDTEI
ncbi:MAG: sialidase family protein [Verrucomicrobiota bacterium]